MQSTTNNRNIPSAADGGTAPAAPGSGTAHVTSADGTAIAYTKAGAGPVLVMVDPALGFRRFGPNPAIAETLSATFTVYSYDRRGRGESTDTAPYAVARELEDLAAILDIAGDAACVFGYSSGAVLVLHAALAGLPIRRMVLFEPPLDFPDEPAPDSDLGSELDELVRAGRRGDAVLHFNRSIGVPESMVAKLTSAPAWPELEKLAHTLVYDSAVTSGFDIARLGDITVPTLLLDSSGSDDRIRSWAARAAAALPSGTYRSLDGAWHGADPAAVAAAVTDYCAAGTR